MYSMNWRTVHIVEPGLDFFVVVLHLNFFLVELRLSSLFQLPALLVQHIEPVRVILVHRPELAAEALDRLADGLELLRA